MRTRLKQQEFTPFVNGVSSISYDHGEYFDVPVVDLTPTPVVVLKEAISDVVGNPYGFNPCSHFVVTYSGLRSPAPYFASLYDESDARTSHQVTLDNFTWSTPPAPPSPTFAQLQDFAWDALEAATTQFQEEVSIANFLFELREMGELLAAKWKSLAGWASDLILTYQFGWKPFLADVKKLFDFSRKTRVRLQYLKKTWGKPTTTHFSRPFTDSIQDQTAKARGRNPLGEFQPEFAPSLDWYRYASGLEFKAESVSGKMTFTMVTCHRLEGLDSAIALCRAFEATLGLNNLPKILWNAMPFSWLFEWWVNVEHTLSAFAVEPFKGKIQVLSACYSIKARCGYGVYQRKPRLGVPADGNGDYVDYDRIGTILTKSYTRHLGLPPMQYVFLQGKPLSASQLAILESLLYLFLSGEG